MVRKNHSLTYLLNICPHISITLHTEYLAAKKNWRASSSHFSVISRQIGKQACLAEKKIFCAETAILYFYTSNFAEPSKLRTQHMFLHSTSHINLFWKCSPTSKRARNSWLLARASADSAETIDYFHISNFAELLMAITQHMFFHITHGCGLASALATAASSRAHQLTTLENQFSQQQNCKLACLSWCQ